MQQQSTRDNLHPASSDIISNLLPFNIGKFKKDINSVIHMLTTKARIVISNQKYEPADIEEILTHKEVSFLITTHLWLHWNKYSTVILRLQGRPFPNLKVLNVGGNRIESIEMLQKCDLSTLEELWLWNNYIVNANSIKKCRFPNLTTLDISCNQIKEWPRLSQLQAPRLEHINIETNLLTSLTDLAKVILRSRGFSVIFTENKLVKIFDQPKKKGKKNITEATFSITGKKFLKYE